MVQRYHKDRLRGTQPEIASPPRTQRRRKIPAFFWVAFLSLIVLSGVLVNWAFLAQQTFAAPLASYSAPGQNTLQQFQAEGQRRSSQQGAFQRPSNPASALKPNSNAPKNKALPSVEPATMHDLTFVLDDSFVQHRPAMRERVG